MHAEGDEAVCGRLETDPKPNRATHALGAWATFFGEDVRTRPMPPMLVLPDPAYDQLASGFIQREVSSRG